MKRVLLIVALVAMSAGGAVAAIKTDKEFVDALIQIESGGNKKIVNGSGHIGLVQFSRVGLEDIGWVKSSGDPGCQGNNFSSRCVTWTEKARRVGVSSVDQFLENDVAQLAAETDALARGRAYVSALKLDQYYGRTINGHVMDEYTTLALIHNLGIGGAERYLASNGVEQQGAGVRYLNKLGRTEGSTTSTSRGASTEFDKIAYAWSFGLLGSNDSYKDACDKQPQLPVWAVNTLDMLSVNMSVFAEGLYDKVIKGVVYSVYTALTAWLVIQGGRIVIAFGDASRGWATVREVWVKALGVVCVLYAAGVAQPYQVWRDYVEGPVMTAGTGLIRSAQYGQVVDQRGAKILNTSLGPCPIVARGGSGFDERAEQARVDIICGFWEPMKASAGMLVVGNGLMSLNATPTLNPLVTVFRSAAIIFTSAGAVVVALSLFGYAFFLLFRLFMLAMFGWVCALGLAFKPFREPAKKIVLGVVNVVLVVFGYQILGKLGIVMLGLVFELGKDSERVSDIVGYCDLLGADQGLKGSVFVVMTTVGPLLFLFLGIGFVLLLPAASGIASLLTNGINDGLAAARLFAGSVATGALAASGAGVGVLFGSSVTVRKTIATFLRRRFGTPKESVQETLPGSS